MRGEKEKRSLRYPTHSTMENVSIGAPYRVGPRSLPVSTQPLAHCPGNIIQRSSSGERRAEEAEAGGEEGKVRAECPIIIS